MHKIWRFLRNLWIGLVIGLKKTEDEAIHQNGVNIDGDTGINQKVSDHSVAKALLRGELTQEVVDLRYRTYEVSREAGRYTYFSPTLATKKRGQDTKFVHIENRDNREVVTIQENKVCVETVADSLHRIDADGKFTDIKSEYNITMKRGTTPRFRLEDFTRKLVVKRGDDDMSAVLDVYVSKYPDDKNVKSKPFIREIERVLATGVRSDIFDIDSVCFETYKAYKLDDMIRFEFCDLSISAILEFDGDYIIRFIAGILDGGTDLSKEFYSERMERRYKNKEKKELNITFDPESNIRVYRCADCGKEVTYDYRELDKLNASENATGGSTTEYLDYEMTEHEFGRMLCRDCMKKEQELLYKRLSEKDKAD